MLTNPEQTASPINFLDRLATLALPSSSKVHNYTQQTNGIDYVFEVTDDGSQAHMTGYGKEISRKDYLLLSQGCYQVEVINYYANPSDLWTALLVKAP